MRNWLLPALLGTGQLALWPGLALARGDTLAPARTAAAVALVVTVALALAVRRSRPVAAAALAAVGVTLGELLVPQQMFLVPGDALLVIGIADLVALYGVAVRRPRRTTLAVLAGLTLWQAAVLAVRSDEYAADLALTAVVYGLVAACGRAGRHRRADRAAAARRLAEAERDRRDAADAERRRLTRELHDVTAHHLTSVVVNASAAQYLAAQRPDLHAAALEYAARTGRETLTALRRLVAVLPTEPEPDLADLADDFRQLGQVVRAEITGDPPPPVAAAMHGIAREALTNTLRYAPGGTVRLRAVYGPDGAELLVEDDGGVDEGAGGHGRAIGAGAVTGTGMGAGVLARAEAGIGASRRADVAGLGGGRGIDGMRERAAAMGGTVEAGPRRDGPGWRVHAMLPPPAGARRRLRRWLHSQFVLDAALALLTLVMPLAGVVLLVEEDGASVGSATLIGSALVAHAAPLLWRRRFPWVVLAAVVLTGWLGPLLVAVHVAPRDGGWLFLFGVAAEMAAVHAVAARGRRPGLTWLAPLAATASGALALSVLMALDPPPDGEAPAGAVATLAVTVLLAVLLAVVIAVPIGASWLAGFVSRRRRERRLLHEETAVAWTTGQAAWRARDERARVAAGLRAAVLGHAARVPQAAEAGDLAGVLSAAREALAAMRALLDGLGSRPDAAAAPSPTSPAPIPDRPGQAPSLARTEVPSSRSA